MRPILPLKMLQFILITIVGGAIVISSPKCLNAQPQSFTSMQPFAKHTREYTVQANDSVDYTLKLALDDYGVPRYFFANVFTPVCLTGECKPVNIDLVWDLLGNYVRYSVPAGEPLTKVDHVEFESEDYQHLDRILGNPQSLLKDFSIYDLVDTRTYHLSDSVDAVTGATPKTIKAEVIGGAVYTCYTLWHIVHGAVVEKMKRITTDHCNDTLLHNFLGSSNHHYQYWAMDKVIDEAGAIDAAFLSDILKIISGPNIFMARYALEKIPACLFSSSDSLQAWLWSVYQACPYALQLDMLIKLESVHLTDQMLVDLSRGLQTANEAQFGRILSLLMKQKHLSAAVLENLSQQLDNPNPKCAAAAYNALSARKSKNRSIRKKLRQFKKSQHNPIY